MKVRTFSPPPVSGGFECVIENYNIMQIFLAFVMTYANEYEFFSRFSNRDIVNRSKIVSLHTIVQRM